MFPTCANHGLELAPPITADIEKMAAGRQMSRREAGWGRQLGTNYAYAPVLVLNRKRKDKIISEMLVVVKLCL